MLYLALGIAGLRPPPLAVAARGRDRAARVIDPLTVIDIGAWLSFAATLGHRRLRSRLDESVARDRRGRGLSAVAAAWSGRALMVATVAAEVVLLPVTASAFARVSVAGVVLNLVAIPAMAVVQIAGLLVVCVAAVWPQLAAAAAAVSRAARRVCCWRRARSSTCVAVAVVASAADRALVDRGLLRRRCCGQRSRHVAPLRLVALGAAALCLIVIVSAPGVAAARPAADRLRLTMVDVGQGDAILVQTPDGHALLVDAGGTPGPFDIGGRVVTPALWALGVRRLDWLAMSHGDRDHVGGAPSVLRDLAPAEIWEGVPVPPDPDRAACAC